MPYRMLFYAVLSLLMMGIGYLVGRRTSGTNIVTVTRTLVERDTVRISVPQKIVHFRRDTVHVRTTECKVPTGLKTFRITSSRPLSIRREQAILTLWNPAEMRWEQQHYRIRPWKPYVRLGVSFVGSRAFGEAEAGLFYRFWYVFMRRTHGSWVAGIGISYVF